MSDSDDASSVHSPTRGRTKRSENGKSPSKERSASHSPAPSKSKRKHSRSRSRSRSRGRRSRRSRSRSSKRHKRHSRSYSRSRSYSPGGRSHSRSPMSNRRRHNGNRENPEPNRCLGVFGLSTYTTERELYDIFSKFGPLDSVTVVIDVKTNTSRGFAFVYFEYYEDARAAKEQCSGMEIDGRKIRVDYSITQRAHTPTPGIYMGKPTYSKRYDKYERYDRRERDWERDYYGGGGGGGGGGYRGRYRSPSPYYSRSRRRHRSRSRSYSPYY